MTTFKIYDLKPEQEAHIQQLAELLVLAFKENFPDAWPTVESGLTEVREALQDGTINRVAITPDGEAVGWIGGIPRYNTNTWELHPLVVHPVHQGAGIGRALIEDFEQQVKERGGLTIYLGSDDENNMTSLSGVDLYPNVWEHIQNIRNFKGHPYEFYQKHGYVIVGVIPDANGFGKPDILMAKRLAR